MRARVGTIATMMGMLLALAIAPAAYAGDPFYGLFTTDMSHPAAQLAGEMDAHASTGVGVLREHLHWDRIERSPGVFDFTDSDALVAAAQQRGMTILPLLIDAPRFYSTAPVGDTSGGWPPRDPTAITRFATELSKRYGTRGTYWGCLLPGLLCRRPYRPITVWQVWNEPDLSSWWKTGVDAGAYAALLRAAYQGLKAGDSSAEVLLAGLTFRALEPGAFLDQLYARGAAPYFDTLALHPYAGTVGGVVTLLRRMRAIADAHGDTGAGIRATEYGFATGGVREWVADPICQAALIAATTRELSARRGELKLLSIAQFQWQDRSSDPTASWPNHAGLLYVDGRRKPAFAAFVDAVAGRGPAPGLSVPEACPAQYQG